MPPRRAAALARALRSTRGRNPTWLAQETGGAASSGGESMPLQRVAASELQAKDVRSTLAATGTDNGAARQWWLSNTTDARRSGNEGNDSPPRAGSRYYYRMVEAEKRLDRPTMLGQDVDFNPAYGDFSSHAGATGGR